MTATAEETDQGLRPETGWNVLHLYYGIDRAALATIEAANRAAGCDELRGSLDPAAAGAPTQLQTYVVPSHKADFGVIAADPELATLQRLKANIQASALGHAITLRYSFFSLTEVSEYVPDSEAYGRILRERESMDPESAPYKTKVRQYESRLEAMNRQRLYPEFPDWPIVCFYPMNKSRHPNMNWYTLPFDERAAMMAEHGKTGMKFAGRVTQLITASTGLDDWEWGVTLWAKNPSFLKEIVYTMRFDEASAKFAEFGPFYPGYIVSPSEMINALRLRPDPPSS